jgi:AcrR family transcriptional regulator
VAHRPLKGHLDKALDSFVNYVYFVNVIHGSEELSPRRKRRRAQRVEDIVEAARALVAEAGFDGLTIAALAEAVDLSPGALYRYFASKDALVAELQARGIDAIRGRFEEQRGGWEPAAGDDPSVAALGALLAAGRFYLRLSRDEPEIAAWLAASLGDRRQLSEEVAVRDVAPSFGALLERVGALFGSACAADALSHGHALERTVIYWSALQGLTAVAKLGRIAPRQRESWFDIDRLGRELSRALCRGWGANPITIERAERWLDERQPSSDSARTKP